MDKLLVLTYSDKFNNNEAILISLLEKYNYNYKIVGRGIKWEGYLSKFPVYISALKELPKDMLVIICDCYDVLIQNYSHIAITRYNEIKSKMYNDIIITGTEDIIEIGITGHELTNYWKLRSNSNVPSDKYLNSGFIMGKANDVFNFYTDGLNILKELSLNVTNDQVPLSLIIEKNPSKYYLDTNSDIIGTVMLNDLNTRFIVKEKVIDTRNNISPIFIHTPFCSEDSFLRYNTILRSIL